jgi:cyclohexadieny/prephenate dehydrogenase
MMFGKIAIIGLGLIGSSIGHAAKRGKLAGEIVGFDADEDVRARSAKLGFTDRVASTLEDAVKDADLVILATPVGAFKSLAEAIAPHLKPGAILSDTGSVKGAVVRDVAPFVPQNAHFIPAHPIAGTEFSGPEAGFAGLFDGRWTILTPLPGADEKAVASLKKFWQGWAPRWM